MRGRRTIRAGATLRRTGMRIPPLGHRTRAFLAIGLALAIQLATALAVVAASGGGDWPKPRFLI
jgi:hypothetical protein